MSVTDLDPAFQAFGSVSDARVVDACMIAEKRTPGERSGGGIGKELDTPFSGHRRLSSIPARSPAKSSFMNVVGAVWSAFVLAVCEAEFSCERRTAALVSSLRVFFAWALLVMGVGLGALPATAEIAANFTSATTVPVTDSSYNATDEKISFTLSFAPPTGTSLTVVNNTGRDFIAGRFVNLAQGETVNLTFGGVTYSFVANYYGGTGNDLVLQWAGTLPMAWGWNGFGQLGDNSTTNRLTPMATTAAGVLAGKSVIALALGDGHSLALCADGTLAAWGKNNYGQLGDNSTTNRLTPVAVNANGVLAGKTVIAITAGGSHCLALCSDGTVVSWGRNDVGQLGENSTTHRSTPVLVTSNGVLAGKTMVAIASGSDHNLALCSDGTLVAWGWNGNGGLGDNTTTFRVTPVAVTTSGALAGKSVTAIAASAGHSFAICSDGSVAGWGENNFGQVGDNSTTDRATPVIVATGGAMSGKTIVSLAAGAFHTVALCSDGTLAAWGWNAFGQLGDNTATNRLLPVAITSNGALAGKTVVAVEAGYGFSVAVCADGTLVTWGDNGSGQLGDNSNTNRLTPIAVATNGAFLGKSVVAAAAGTYYTLALVATLPPPTLTLGTSELSSTSAVLNGAIAPNGNSATLSFEYGLTPSLGTAVPATPPTVSGTSNTGVSAALSGLTPETTYYFRITAITVDGTFTSATQTFTTLPAPLDATFTSASTVPATVASYNASARILNLSLQFAPATGTSLTVVKNTGLSFISGQFTNLTHGQEVSLSYGGTTYDFVANYYGGSGNDLVLQWAGSLPVAWGVGTNGQLGSDASNIGLPLPVNRDGALAGKTVVSIAGGSSHSLALCSDGTLLAWGANSSGQLGDGTKQNRSTPVLVDRTGALAGKTVVAIAAGSFHNLALCSDGTVYAWGYNLSGQIGDGSDVEQLTAVAVNQTGALAGKTVVAIAAGGFHNLALCSDGTLVAWGENYYGQIGDNTNSRRYTPLAISGYGALAGRNVTAIVAGGNHSLALCSDGAVVTWGSNGYGQLGNNSTTVPNTPTASTPVAITGNGALAGRVVTAVAAGDDFSFAMCADGTLASWGLNDFGQLGDTTITNRSVPVAITGNGALAGKTVASIAAGRRTSVALCTDGNVVSWGGNQSGELGDGTFNNSPTPVSITGKGALAGKTAVVIAAGSFHNLALVAVPAPSLIPLAATSVSTTTATLNGTVNLYGRSASIGFLYGLTADYDVNVGATPSPVSGSSPTAVSATISGLTPGTTYHYCIIAENSNRTLISADQTFTTLANQAITFANPGTRTFGDDPFVLGATASSGLPVSFSVVSGPAIVSGDTLTLTGAGTVVVRSSQAGNATYAAAPDVDQTFTVVTPPPLNAAFGSATTVAVTASTYRASERALNLNLQFAPATGTSLTVVNNTGLGFISGRFTNLAQGETVNLTFGGVTYSFVANYFGGTGNDLVLQWAGTLPAAWGWNEFGQLGDNTTTNRLTPIATTAAGVLAGKTVIALALGDGHSLALCSDGTLAAWGKNDFGQLGDNSTTNRLTPVAVNANGVLAGKTVIAITAGASHCLALCSDGTVAGWGRNDVGQLGDNSTTHRSTPVLVTSNGVLAGKTVVAIASGVDHNLALCSDGTLVAWGWNGSGGLGDNTTTFRVTPVAVTTSGALAGKSVTAIAASAGHSFALCSDGTLAGWGENNFGQLGDNSTTDRATPVVVSTGGTVAGKTIVSLAAGAFHTVALCSDGALAAWGWNAFGQLGDNSTTNRLLPVAVSTTGVLAGKTVVALKAGYAFNLALCSDGTLVAWGDNGSGQLGDNTTTSRSTPVAVNTTGGLAGKTVALAAAGTYYSLALVATPLPPAFTLSPATGLTTSGATLNGTVTPYGVSATISFAYGLTSNYGSAVAATPSPIGGTSPSAVSATLSGLTPSTTYHYQITAVTSNGSFASANQTFTTLSAQNITFANPGNRTYGDDPFALNASASSGLPVSFSVVSGPAIVSGNTLTLTGSGTVVVRASQAGDATFGAAPDVDQTFTVASLPPLDAVFTSAGNVPVTANGYNATGRNLNLTLQFAPVAGTTLTIIKNTGLNFIRGQFINLTQGQVVAFSFEDATYSFVANYFGGSGNDLVLHWAGTLPVAWGSNQANELGNGSTSGGESTPGAVSSDGPLAGKTVISVAAGRSHVLALCSDGTLVAWGFNGFGQLGDGSKTNRPTAVVISGNGALAGKTVVSIAAGYAHSLALCADGTLVAWGSAYVINQATPVGISGLGALAGKTVASIAAGDTHSLALCSDGTLVAWGSNSSGQLGDGSKTDRITPVAITGNGVLAGKTVASLAVGFGHSFALCTDGTLAAWGGNALGQLGDTTTVDQSTPVAITGNGGLAGRTVVSMAAGFAHSLALCSDGTVVAWGLNNYGQLGAPSFTMLPTPDVVTGNGALAGKTVISLKAGWNHSLAQCSDGSLVTFGLNSVGQLGNGTFANPFAPVAITGNGALAGKIVSSVAAGGFYSLALVAPPPSPILTTSAVTGRTTTSAVLNGSVNPFGVDATVSFSYGLNSSYGSTIAATPSPVSGTTPTALSATVTGLIPGTTYHYQLTAVTGNGTFTSANQTFTTLATQTITFPNPGAKTYGDAPFALAASASSGLPVSFIVVSGPATLSGSTLTLTGTGTVAVRASQAGNASYQEAADVTQSFSVISVMDAWRVTHFGTASTAFPFGDGDDADFDGLPNFLEFAFGTSPINSRQGALVYTGTLAGGGTLNQTGQPSIRIESGVRRAIYLRRKDAAAAGLVYTPQFSLTLNGAWVGLDNGVTPTVLADDGTYEVLSVPFPTPTFDAASRAFFRIVVDFTPP